MSDFNWLAHKKGYKGWFREDGHVPGSQGGSVYEHEEKNRRKINNERVDDIKKAVEMMKDYDEYQKTKDPDLKKKIDSYRDSLDDLRARVLYMNPDSIDTYMSFIPKDRQKEVQEEYEFIKKRNASFFTSSNEFKNNKEENIKESTSNEFKNDKKENIKESTSNEFKNDKKEAGMPTSVSSTPSKDEPNNEGYKREITSSQLKSSSNDFRIASKGFNDISSGFDKAYTHLHTMKNEKNDRSKKVESLSNEELRRVIERIRLNEEYNKVTSKKKSDGYHRTMAALAVLGSAATVTATGLSIAAGIKQLRNK